MQATLQLAAIFRATPPRRISLPTAPQPNVTWRVSTASQLPMHNWDGDYVVYNPLSGNTHILDIVTGEVLKFIAAGPAPASAINGRIANFLELPAEDGNIARHVDEILDLLDDLGLIEPAGEC